MSDMGAHARADVGRQQAAQSLGLPQCAAATYGGNNDVQGAEESRRERIRLPWSW